MTEALPAFSGSIEPFHDSHRVGPTWTNFSVFLVQPKHILTDRHLAGVEEPFEVHLRHRVMARHGSQYRSESRTRIDEITPRATVKAIRTT